MTTPSRLFSMSARKRSSLSVRARSSRLRSVSAARRSLTSRDHTVSPCGEGKRRCSNQCPDGIE